MDQASEMPGEALEKVTRSLEKLGWAILDLHDGAHNIWLELHSDVGDVEFYDCKLCGATMYPCIDYTHEPDCQVEIVTSAIDEFDKAVKAALAKTAV